MSPIGPSLNPINLLIITALLSGVMLLVLVSIKRSGLPGVADWLRANLLIVGSLILFAARGRISDWASIVVANTMLAWGMCEVYIGLGRFFGRPIRRAALALPMAAVPLALAWLTFVTPSFSLRVVLMSVVHTVICAAIAVTVVRFRPRSRPLYSYGLTIGVAAFFTIGHAIRGLFYLFVHNADTASIMSPGMNVAFLTLGAIVMPTLTMCAVMMAHDAVMASAEKAANTDFLTHLLSRRALSEATEREIAGAARTGRPLCLVMFDIDHFKAINDTYGHAAGDAVLKAFASLGLATVRSDDYLGRMGGEEFALLLPETPPAVAVAIAERMLMRTRERGVHVGGEVIRHTVSAGVAAFERGDTLETLLAAADRALYAAKEGGRNRVIHNARSASEHHVQRAEAAER
ncbi:GGDEF domain-containing protein [Uliginosibacterium sp. sgz301328]|uniref:GGDEF domain-containing protein n=1 Tax=Uliginosibacterium sp. sgz301328 TaxID=3243764 RepID=UPI00359DB5AA